MATFIATPSRPALHTCTSVTHLKRFEERSQKLLVWLRSSHGFPIDRSAHLRHACGVDWTLRLVEGQASVFPFKAAVRHQSARLSFKVAYDILVMHLDHHALRQDRLPMAHQACVGPIVTAKFCEVIAMRLIIREQQRKARPASIDRITAGVDDSGI